MLLPRGAEVFDGAIQRLSPPHAPALSSSADGEVLSSVTPTTSSGSVVVRPKVAKYSDLAGLLDKGPLPSKGTVDHGQKDDWVCAKFQRGECVRGSDCHRCHAPEHDHGASAHGGGRTRQRAAKQKRSIREIHTPEPWDLPAIEA